MNDHQFLMKKQKDIIEIRIGGANRRGLKVGKYLLILGNDTGYHLYSFHSRLPLIENPFDSIMAAYSVAKSIDKHYREFLPLLQSDEYTERFFELTQHSLPIGHKMCAALDQLKSIGQITQADLMVAFDKPIT